MNPTLYGIKNCDTMKKAFAWFEGAGVAHEFHDYKKAGIDAATLARWCDRLGWEALVNRRGTTWRKLAPEQQAIADTAGAIALMQAQPSLIRRPVVEFPDGELLVGLDTAALERLCRG
ncbi:MAG: ArsC family reductase [Thauera sp.]|nr:ArsC family reductase [Thauera sp.]